MNIPKHDPALDLSFERFVELPPEALWAAWTQPELLMPWFCPRPWTTIACEIDLRPGGLFRTVMRSPEGQEFPNVGSYLEVVPNRRLVWTNTLAPGFRPARGSWWLSANASGTKLEPGPHRFSSARRSAWMR